MSSSQTAPPTALQRVVGLVESMIFEELNPGDQLLSEGELATRFGVSRLTVREGIKQLSARGLVETHNGRRTLVAVPNGRSVGDYFRSNIRRDARALLELMEVRLALETHIAGLAAVNARGASIRAMEAAIAEMAEGILDSERFIEADSRFHEQLAFASGNQMLATLIEELGGCLEESRHRSVAAHLERGLSLDDALEHHKLILERVRARDSKGAALAMRRHLRDTRQDLRASTA